MPGSLDPQLINSTLAQLSPANRAFKASYPGEPTTRQPLHTVYGGAQLFKAETCQRLGELARAHMATYAPSADALTAALGLPGHLGNLVYARVTDKLVREPVEDFRIDFEDGFGIRPDAEEDEVAVRTAQEVARGMRENLLPAFCGIRIKTLSEELKARAIRTLDIFVSTLLEASGGKLPNNFVITVPKVVTPEQVDVVVKILSALEKRHGLPSGTLAMELMIEVTQAILDAQGRSNLPHLLEATAGRCKAAHFGTYDYTASANITADHQVMDHPVCDFAKHMMQVAYASRGIFLSDGATNIMPVGPHKGDTLTAKQQAENNETVHRAWRIMYAHVRHSLEGGFYQGWDLHPGQLPVRYAACFTFFLQGIGSATERLSNFINKATQATLVGDVFDDAATGQGLLNYFLRAYNSGAITLDDVKATGLTLEEIQSRSFVHVLESRKRRTK